MLTAKTCSCFGHLEVEITDELRSRTEKAVEEAIENGVTVFLFGGRSDFDDLVYEIVTQIKEREGRSDIQRIFCFPLDSQLRKPPRWYQQKEYEDRICPVKRIDWWYTAIYYRNCAMIDESDLVLFYAEARENSGAYKAYQYAVRAHKKLLNFAEKA